MSETPPADPTAPFEAQRAMHELLSQETRHHILQTILGHPAHLASLAELGYYSQKSESAVLDQLDVLQEHDFLTVYDLPDSQHKRDLPGRFYGLTDRGALTLEKYNYIRGIPLLREVHENTVKTAGIRRHEDAPRPDLPEAVGDVLDTTAGTEPGAGTNDTGEPAATAGQRTAPEELAETLRDIADADDT